MAAGLLKGPLGDAEAAALLDLLVLVVARLKGWGAAITAKGLERDGRGWAAMWKGASLQERVQMVRDVANLSARELTVEAQRRKKGREEKREDRRQKDATQPKQEEAGAQRAAGTAPVETAGLLAGPAERDASTRVGANRGPAAAHVRAVSTDARKQAAAHAGAMGSQTGPVRGSTRGRCRHRGSRLDSSKGTRHPYLTVGGRRGMQQAQMAYTPPQAQGGGQMTAQGGGRPPRQYICFRCRKPGHIAPHCTVNLGDQSSQ